MSPYFDTGPQWVRCVLSDSFVAVIWPCVTNDFGVVKWYCIRLIRVEGLCNKQLTNEVWQVSQANKFGFSKDNAANLYINGKYFVKNYGPNE